MGGNVFKQGQTRRYTAVEYFEVVERITPVLDIISNNFKVIPSYTSKPSFGDMDILIVPCCDWNKTNLDNFFSSNGNVIHNGGVWSLVFEQIQVDLITTDDVGFLSALDYFSYNDFGNLRGKIFHKFGMKFGHDGLTLPVRSNDHTLGTIMLSQNVELINSIFGFTSGPFDTLEDMFDSVCRSPYYNPEVFSFEHMNAAGRVRNKKRSSYNEFLKYITSSDDDFYQFEKDKSVYLDWIFTLFPNAKPEFDKLWERKLLIEAAALKFNGNLVKEWTGLDGILLGNLMKKLRPLLPPEVVVLMLDSKIMETVKENL